MKVLAIAPMHNEGAKAVEVIRRFPPGVVQEILIVDDASTDGTGRNAAEAGATVLPLARRSGCGVAIRHGLEYGLKKGCDVFIVLAANGKDDPQEIPGFLAAIKEKDADFVQGSRYLAGGTWTRMPFHRLWGTRFYSFFFSVFLGKWITDATNGFRAFRRTFLEDPRVNFRQDWLDGYAVETYLFAQAIRLGYRVAEVPVSKTYPVSKTGYTKVRPWFDWWNHFKPVPLLVFGIKK